MPMLELITELDCPVPTPIRFPAVAGPKGDWVLAHAGSGALVPAQADGDHVVAVLPRLSPGRHSFEIGSRPATGLVSLKESGPHMLEVHLPEGHFTTYHCSPETARPYFYPVIGPGGKRLTRNYP
ncbi:MAG: hypothetical protein FJX77_12995, partial [Armatimonadetes bacterium]|nr:hypothetical protein [Armatimonadota bacterium]